MYFREVYKILLKVLLYPSFMFDYYSSFIYVCVCVWAGGMHVQNFLIFAFQVYWRTPKGPQYLRREVKRRKYYFDIHRPWTTEFQMQNERGSIRKKVFVEPIRDWSFFKGDRVRAMCI